MPGKNTRLLNGHPLIAYTIAAAKESGVFSDIYVSSESVEVAVVAGYYGACTVIRPDEYATDASPDIAWVRHLFGMWVRLGDAFAILRPTSPFRTADTIRRAYQEFMSEAANKDSIRAVEPAQQTPYKMWTWAGHGHPIKPLLDAKNADGVPYHSCPTQTCPAVYVQNSSLEMSWTTNVETHGSISGRKVAPFWTQGLEGFSIDTEDDWAEAERLALAHPDALPPVELARVSALPPGQ